MLAEGAHGDVEDLLPAALPARLPRAARHGATDYAETAIVQPHGIGDLRGAVTRTRSGPGTRMRVGEGIGIAEFGFAEAIATAAQAARGARAIGEPREVTFEGRPA
jgi:hypothetical protein